MDAASGKGATQSFRGDVRSREQSFFGDSSLFHKFPGLQCLSRSYRSQPNTLPNSDASRLVYGLGVKGMGPSDHLQTLSNAKTGTKASLSLAVIPSRGSTSARPLALVIVRFVVSMKAYVDT
jgi:hypothetical protein